MGGKDIKKYDGGGKKPRRDGVIVIPPLILRNSTNFTPNEQMPYPNAYKQVKEYLKGLLHPEVDHHKTHPIPALKQLSPAQVVEGLWHQLDTFWHGEYPFNQKVESNNNSLAWWASLRYHPHASVLAVRDNLLWPYYMINNCPKLALGHQNIFRSRQLNA